MSDERAEGLALVGDDLVPLADARVPLLDRGYLLGDGIFETMRTENGRLFLRELHAKRLRHGVQALGLPERVADDALVRLERLRAAAVDRYGPRLYLRLQITTDQADEYAGTAGRHAVTALARPLKPYPEAYYADGIRVTVVDLAKRRGGRLAGIKALSSLPHVAARREARDAGAQDAVLLNDRGRICEATTSNAVAVHGDLLYAPGPDEGALDGVTRRVLLDVADAEGYRVTTRLSLRRLLRAGEAFLTNTIGGVVPISGVLGKATRFAGPHGPVYRRLTAGYENRLRLAGEAAEIPVSGGGAVPDPRENPARVL